MGRKIKAFGRKVAWLGLLPLLIIVGVALGCDTQTDDHTPGSSGEGARVDQAGASSKSVPVAKGRSTSFGNGTHVIGKDIQAGTYQTDGGSNCYWERLSGFGGGLHDIIANEIPQGSIVVTIQSTDAGFKSQGCGKWSMVNTSPRVGPVGSTTEFKSSFSDGTYRVGSDIEPGTYGTSGGSNCYWERLSGFGGGLNDIIANDLPQGSVIVTISGSDAGFTTHGCGEWRKQ
jgi:hypothetical protein